MTDNTFSDQFADLLPTNIRNDVVQPTTCRRTHEDIEKIKEIQNGDVRKVMSGLPHLIHPMPGDYVAINANGDMEHAELCGKIIKREGNNYTVELEHDDNEEPEIIKVGARNMVDAKLYLDKIIEDM